MKQVLLLCIFSLSVLFLSAQDDQKRMDYDSRHQIGTSASFTNGVGLTYRFTEEKHGVQIVASPFIGLSGNESISVFNVALNYNYYIRKGKGVDFSLFIGGQLSGFTFDTDLETSSKMGLGTQIDFHLGDELNFEVQLGYGIYSLGDSPFSNLTAGVGFLYNIYL